MRNNKSACLKDAIHYAIRRYRRIHNTVSAERQKDIDWLLETANDFSMIDVKKHVAINNYIKSIHVGLLGRSELRRYILHALESVPLMGLIDELLEHHKAEIQAKKAEVLSLFDSNGQRFFKNNGIQFIRTTLAIITRLQED